MSWVLTGGGMLLGLFYFLKSRKVKQIEHNFTIARAGTQKPPEANVTVRLISTGTEPIKADDFEGDLVIELSGAISIASARIIKLIPENLKPVHRIHRNEIHLSPLLLNVRDTIEFHIVSTGVPSDVRLAVRIAGISSPRRVRVPGFPTGRRDILYRYVSVFGLLLIAASQLPRMVGDYASSQMDLFTLTVGLLASVMSVLTFVWTAYEHRKSRRWRS
ncbi:MAG: hypothetical protein ACRDRG_03955 [Pseudonocardiaceae bacterium]